MIRLGIDVKSIKSTSVVGQKAGAKTPAWEQTLELLYKEDRNNLFVGIGCLSAPLIAIVWFLSSIVFNSPPENITTTNSSSSSTPTKEKEVLGYGPTGYSLSKGSDGCIYVKGLTEADLARMNTDVFALKKTIKEETGSQCVFYE